MSMTAAGISSRLGEIVGSSSVIADPAQLAAYRIGGMSPGAAVRPGSDDQVAEIVRFAAAEKLAIVPTGARTKLGMGISLQRYDLALDMAGLDQIVAYDADDLTLGVEPGVPLSRLAGVLAGHRQFLPLAVPFMSRATVGGTISSGVDSPLRQFYGTGRDYVLGMEFVTGDGRLVKSGGRVVKNVSGYDLHKLMIGAMGSLGVITKVNFRTFPMMAPAGVFVALFESAERAVEMRHRLARSPLRPLTIEILSPHASELLSGGVAARIEPGQMPASMSSNAHWAFVVGFAGTEKVLGRYERDLRQMAGSADVALLDGHGASVVAGRIREFVPVALESSPATTIVKMSVLPGRMSELLGDAASAAASVDLRWAAIARGVGVIYVALLPRARSEITRSQVVRAIEQLTEACRRREANITVPWRPSDWKSLMPARKATRSDLDQMRKLKNVFDPGAVFAPDIFSRWS